MSCRRRDDIRRCRNKFGTRFSGQEIDFRVFLEPFQYRHHLFVAEFFYDESF